MHPYSSIDTTAAWKKLRFILSVRSDFCTIPSSTQSYSCIPFVLFAAFIYMMNCLICHHIIVLQFCYVLLLLLLYPLWVFHTTVTWWSFIRVWVIETLLGLQGLFSVFWSTSTMRHWKWMIWILPPISIHSNSLSNPSETVPSALTITCITINLIFHSLFFVCLLGFCFCSQAKSKYLSIFSLSFIFTL